MDLGSIIGGVSDIYGTYTQYQTSKQMAQQPVGGTQPVFLEEAYDFFFDEATGQTVARPKQKCKRSRRKRLATVSDIRDLAALKSVLSPSEFKTYIATRGYR